MLDAAALPLSPADLACQQACDAQRYRTLLHELMDVGMELVRAVREQGTAENRDPAAAHEAAVTFDLLSRAVRRTVALARRVAEPLPQQANPARRRSVREVEDVSQWSDSDLGLDPGLPFDAEAAEAFRAELTERLDRAELDDEVGRRPIEEVIAEIYRDLGLDRFLGGPPRAPRAAQDTEALRAWAARPPGAGPAPDMPRPAPEPCTGEAGADAAPAPSDSACVAQMWRVLAEAGHPLAFKPRDG